MESSNVGHIFSALPGIWIALLTLSLIVFSGAMLIREMESKVGFWLIFSPILALFLYLMLFLASGSDFPERPGWEWILPRQENVALRISFDVDAWSAIIGIAFGLGTFSWIFSFLERKKMFTRGSLPAALLGYSGILVSWSSGSVAFSLLGIALAFVSTTAVLQLSVESDADSKRITLFLLPRLIGIFILLLGFMGFAAHGLGLDFGPSTAHWVTDDLGGLSMIFSRALIGIGFFLLLQPFPGAGALWLPSATHSSVFGQTVLIPIPLAALALLFRMEPHFSELEIWTPWISVMSVVGLLIAVAQFFQSDFRGMIRGWIVLGPILCSIALGLAGKTTAFTLLVSWILLIPSVCGLLENGKNRTNTVLLCASVSAALGFFGFFAASGFIHAYTSILERPAFAALFILISLGYAAGLWRIVSVHFQKKSEDEKIPVSSAVLFICVLLLGGWFLSGTWSGGFFHDKTDLIEGMSQLEWVKGFLLLQERSDPQVWTNAVLIHSAVLVSGGLLGYFSRATDLNRFFPRLGHWVQMGFGFDRVFHGVFSFGARASFWVNQKVSDSIWDSAWPRLGEKVANAFQRASARAESGLSVVTKIPYFRAIEAPAKLVQLIQSGDSHWYLFFSVLCAFIALMNFIRI